MINTPSALELCDDNNDGVMCFNLHLADSQITSNPNLVVTYHETFTDAQTGYLPYASPYCNLNSLNTQTLYVRVVDPNAPACYSTTTLQLIVHPRPLPKPIVSDYVLCDVNHPNDGVEIFDLHTKDLEIANGNVGVGVDYYLTQGDAIAQLPGTQLSNLYPNITPNHQTIWFNLHYTATGCNSVGSLNLVVNPLPSILSPFYAAYSLCDTTAPIGYEVFDLQSQVNYILQGQLGVAVHFYPSLTDATNNTSEIVGSNLMYTNIIPTVQTLGIRLTNITTGCYIVSTMDIRVEPLPNPVTPPTPYVLCGTNQSGLSIFDLTTLTPIILQGVTDPTSIGYYETYTSADTNQYMITDPSHYQNITPSPSGTSVQILYVRVENTITHCYKVISIQLDVNPAPVIPMASSPLPNLVNCDTDSNNQDGFSIFNLTQNTAALLALQSGAASNYTVTYHELQSDALTGSNSIIQPNIYHNTTAFNQTIWVSIVNNTTHCRNVTSFKVIVNIPLGLTPPAALSKCDDDSHPNNLYTTFDLSVKDAEITHHLPGYTVHYYPSYPVTASSVEILPATAYTNVTPYVQSLGVVVVDNVTGCKSYTQLDIRVLPIPVPQTNPLPLPAQCAINYTTLPVTQPNVPVSVFDLTQNEAYIRNGDNTLTFHYFQTQGDAAAFQNELLPATAATVSGDVWIRVENNFVDSDGHKCYKLVKQQLTVNPLPTVVLIGPYKVCDLNTSGFAYFDLSTQTPLLLGTNQLVSNFTVSYYTTLAGAQSGTGALPTMHWQNTVAYNQTIYVRVVNNATGCVNDIGTFNVIVEEGAVANGPQYYSSCDDDSNPYDGVHQVDLTQFASQILGNQSPAVFLLSYYHSQTDADAGDPTTAIANPTNYLTSDTTVYVRVENSNNIYAPICYATTSIIIHIEPSPNPMITTHGAGDTMCVDYSNNNIIRPIILDSQMTGAYQYQWYEDGTPIPGATSSTYSVPPSATGAIRTFKVSATSNSVLGCQTLSAGFTVQQSGPALLGAPPYTVTNAFENNQIITVNLQGGWGVYQYSLDDGPFQDSLEFDNVSLGVHTITIRDIKTMYSCQDVVIDNVQTIDYPHYFTPNGDGINDTWNIHGLYDQPNAKIYIFDRYGKLLKQISPQSTGWDGTYNGAELPSTDYWFTVDFIEQATSRQFKAHFSLKR